MLRRSFQLLTEASSNFSIKPPCAAARVAQATAAKPPLIPFPGNLRTFRKSRVR